MPKTTHALRFSLATAFAIILCQTLSAQQPVVSTNADSADLVAEIRFVSFPVTVDKDGKQQCEMLDQLLRSTDLRNIEVQCPNRGGNPAIQDSNNPLKFANNPGIPNGHTVDQPNNRQDSALVANLNAESVFSLLQSAKGNSRANICQAPTITMHSGQEAEVNAETTSPFVTGVERISGDFAVALQPIVSLIPEGLQLKISARIDADKIVVNATVENWAIRGVETIDIGNLSGQPIQVQFPDVDVNSAFATGQVASGESLLIVPSPSFTPPHQVRGETGPRMFRKNVLKEENCRMVILITMRMAGPVSQQSPPQPDPELLSGEQAFSFYMSGNR